MSENQELLVNSAERAHIAFDEYIAARRVAVENPAQKFLEIDRWHELQARMRDLGYYLELNAKNRSE